ncbi:ABC transporter permease [Microbacterium lacticum]
MSTFVIERRKSKRAWSLLVVAALLVGLNAANGISNYLSNTDTFDAQGVTWVAVWGQAGLLWSTLFFPFLIILRAASLTRMEHEQGNWRRLASYGAHLRIYWGKLLVLAGFVALCQAIFIAAMLLSSLGLGFSLTGSDVAAVIGWGLLGVAGGLSVAAIQLLVGILVRSYATTVAIGLVASIGSLMVALVAPFLETVYPYAQIAVGMRVRALDWPGTAETVGFLIWNLVLIVVAVFVGRLVLRRKEY